MVVFATKFHRRHDDEVGEVIHGSLALELLWTIIPLGITMVMFVWGAQVFFHMTRAPKNAMEIYVVGKQWMWKAQHMDGAREINELHVPIGRPVKLIMGSEDVIHSFFIPDFRVKADVVPGRYNTMWFTATKPGRYHIFCTQYCGTKHSNMIGWVTAMEPGRLPDVAERRLGRRQHGGGGREAVRRSRRATPATSTTARAAARC